MAEHVGELFADEIDDFEETGNIKPFLCKARDDGGYLHCILELNKI
jgi:hypothetical protein